MYNVHTDNDKRSVPHLLLNSSLIQSWHLNTFPDIYTMRKDLEPESSFAFTICIFWINIPQKYIKSIFLAQQR